MYFCVAGKAQGRIQRGITSTEGWVSVKVIGKVSVRVGITATTTRG